MPDGDVLNGDTPTSNMWLTTGKTWRYLDMSL